MLDNVGDIQVATTINNVTSNIMRTSDGRVTINVRNPGQSVTYFSNGVTYFPNGNVIVSKSHTDEIIDKDYGPSSEENQPINGTIIGSYKTLETTITYYPNGTITIIETTHEDMMQHIVREENSYSNPLLEGRTYNTNLYTAGNITKYSHEYLSYDEILKQHPMYTMDSTAEFFVNANKFRLEAINKEQLQEESILVFTADYGLYWWDYIGGYDIVLAELGWNHTTAQDIALIRGAANMQNKNWGTIITWKYNQAPYLANGEEIFEQMKTSYETGAQYILIFRECSSKYTCCNIL